MINVSPIEAERAVQAELHAVEERLHGRPATPVMSKSMAKRLAIMSGAPVTESGLPSDEFTKHLVDEPTRQAIVGLVGSQHAGHLFAHAAVVDDEPRYTCSCGGRFRLSDYAFGIPSHWMAL